MPVSSSGILVEQASCLFHFRASWWNGHLGGMGILVEWACWWNRHLACFIPERARCPLYFYWWNRHLACFMFRHLGGIGILPVSFPSGQDAHSTKLVIPDSRFPIPDSRFPIPCSLYYPNTS
ncbi:MAG: hypothetical protein F6K55_02945 [Moorea sp. SIO4A3]|nr:hypothetical protein [Moorena sp. SIO4A3]